MPFCVDIETVGVRSSCGVLSLSIVYFGHSEDKHNIEYLKENTLTVKFNLIDQIQYNRTTDKSTVDWWNKQSDEVRKKSFLPSDSDVNVVDGIKQVNEYIKQKCLEHNTKLKDENFWCRGQLEPVVLQDLCNAIGQPQIQPAYWMWRDIRTIIHYMYNAPRGYTDIDYPSNQEEVKDLYNSKHDPKTDIILDILQIYYGVFK